MWQKRMVDEGRRMGLRAFASAFGLRLLMPAYIKARQRRGERAGTLVLQFAAVLLMTSLAFAQILPTPDQKLDQARGELDQIEASLTRADQSDKALQNLRLQLDPVMAIVDGVIADLSPKLAAIKSRLDQLAPKTMEKPADKSATEKLVPVPEPAPDQNLAAEAEHADQEKLYKDVDATLRRARALSVEAEQTVNQIQERRRTLFTRALFEQSSSLLRPGLWLDMLNGLPHDVRAAQTVVGDWWNSQAKNLDGWHLPVLGALLAMLLALGWPVQIIARRVLTPRNPQEAPARLTSVLAAANIVVVMVCLPVVFGLAIIAMASGFGLETKVMRPLFTAVWEGALRVAALTALARAVFSPTLPQWRLPQVGTPAAVLFVRLVLIISVTVSLAKLFSAFAEVIGAALPLVVVLRGTGAVVVALVLASSFSALNRMQVEEEASAQVAQGAGPPGLFKLVAWLAVLAIIGAVCVGYIAFAVFLVDQFVWIAFVSMSAYLLLGLAEEGIPASLKPGAPLGRLLGQVVGLRREALDQIAILLTGVLHLAIYGISLMLVIAPWGVQPDDFGGSLRTAFFGFKLGDVSISPSNIFIALLLFGFVLGVTKAIQQWLETRYLPLTHLDLGLRNSIKTSLGYLGFIIALSVSLSHLGLGFDRLAIVAGALSVGIGFGLQSIVNNFVSGLILLWERAIRVGDWIVVGEDQGYVRRINVRSTEIETFERSTVIVPNSSLVSGVVKNWLRGDRIGRVKITLIADPAAKVDAVREIMVRAAKDHEEVIKIPSPSALFVDLTETGAKLELYCYVEDVQTGARVKSDLLFAIRQRLEEQGLLAALVNNNQAHGALMAMLRSDAPVKGLS